jgi:hypothetical protein
MLLWRFAIAACSFGARFASGTPVFFWTDRIERTDEMITGDVFNVVIDAQTIALVDAWARKSAFEPSRRQAVRELLRQALRAHELRAAKAAVPEQRPAS